MIMMTEKEHGKKIQLTSDDYLDLCASLGMGKFGVISWHLTHPERIEPVFITFCSIYVDLAPHSGLTQLQIKRITWLPTQNECDGFFMQCTGIIYILLRENWFSIALSWPLMSHSFLTVSMNTMDHKAHDVHEASICVSWFRPAICLIPFYSFINQISKSPGCYVSLKAK